MDDRKSTDYRRADDLSIQYRKLDNPIFADYIWYRTCEINNINSFFMQPNSIRELKDLLLKLRCSEQSQKFMEEYEIKFNGAHNINKWIKIHYAEFEKNCLNEKDCEWLENRRTRLQYFIWRLMEHCYDISNLVHENRLPLPYAFVLKETVSDGNIKESARMQINKISTGVKKSDIIIVINRVLKNKKERKELTQFFYEKSQIIMSKHEVASWFTNDKENKTSWMSDYLDRCDAEYNPLVLRGSAAHTDDIISFFDVLSITNIDKYKLLVANFKKSWNQKTYRDKNKEKKQYSIVMSKDIGGLLDKLSEKENKNKNDIVEALIRRAYAENF